MNPSIQLKIATGHGELPVSAEHSKEFLPTNMDSTPSKISYLDYLNAVCDYLSKNNYAPVCTALSSLLQRRIKATELERLELISQKHGALYHVAQLRSVVGGRIYSLAINSAIRPEQQAVLESEFEVLKRLHPRWSPAFLPITCLMEKNFCTDSVDSFQSLAVMICEWFDGYHEFHLTRNNSTGQLNIWLWDYGDDPAILSQREAFSLYRQASYILTVYFDTASFKQIYPWHHAAGDFVVRRDSNGIKVRLISARGYRSLVPCDTGRAETWIGLIHYFANLCLRMRLDRLDGTGELLWAPAEYLPGVVCGFLDAWRDKVMKDPQLPTAQEVLEVWQSFKPKEWETISETVLGDCLMEADEHSFILSQLEEHSESLYGVIGSIKL